MGTAGSSADVFKEKLYFSEILFHFFAHNWKKKCRESLQIMIGTETVFLAILVEMFGIYEHKYMKLDYCGFEDDLIIKSNWL